MEASKFKQTFLPCSSRLYAVALRLTGNGQTAEDLVQDTLLRLWMKRDTLPPDFNAASYSMATLRNIFLDGRRRKALDETDEPLDRLVVANGRQTDTEIECSDAAALVRTLISRFPAKHRQDMTMPDLEGLANEEIRRVTGLTEINIRSLLSRARSTVRQQFKKLSAHGCSRN